jgi:CO/xanthine dehydrogenase Mo-binding subunit
MVYDREEDMAATTKRHPSLTRHRTAVTEDGRLVALDIEFLIDGGAYATLSAVVLSRGSIHSAGPYRCPNVRIKARALATNHPPQGAYRGFGNPQSIFALERHLDQIARELGLTPEELRRRNFLVDGDDTATGQGTNTIFAQIVADALGLPYDMVEIARPDTAQVPNSGPTVASRTVMVVGKLLETAAVGLKQALIQSGHLRAPYTPDEFSAACARYLEKYPDLRIYSQYFVPPTIRWSDETYLGDAYAAYAWAVYVAEVSLDTRTYEARVEDFVAMQEVGKVVHPLLAAGQVEGGVAQGIGFALCEQVVWKDGRMINNQMTNYIMPTSADLPPIRALFHEVPYSGGPQGAKGVGELPIDGPGPAIVNALQDAAGICIREIPCTPEMLMEAYMDG